MAAHQAPPSLGFSRQEYWSELPFPSPMNESEKWKWSRSVTSDSQRPHGLQPTRLLHPWDFLGKSTGVNCHHLLWMAIESEGFQERGHHTHVHRHTHTHTHTHRGNDLPLYGEDHDTTHAHLDFFVSLPLLCPSGKHSWSLGLLVWTIERPPDSSGDKVTSESEVAQSCLILCDPMDCSLPGFSVHGIFQARVLEWVAIFLLQGIFLNQGLNPGLPHCRQTDALPSEPPGKPVGLLKQWLSNLLVLRTHFHS